MSVRAGSVLSPPSGADAEEVLRERVVAAAATVLRRTQYQSLKIQLVARVSGIAVGSVYRFFQSKEELMAAIYRQELLRATTALWQLTAAGTPEERVTHWIEAIVGNAFGVQHARSKWYSTLPEDVVVLARRDADEHADPSAPLRNAIRDGVRDGSFPHADPVADTVLITSLCTRLCAVQTPWHEQEPAVAQASVVDFVLGSLRRGSPARAIEGDE